MTDRSNNSTNDPGEAAGAKDVLDELLRAGTSQVDAEISRRVEMAVVARLGRWSRKRLWLRAAAAAVVIGALVTLSLSAPWRSERQQAPGSDLSTQLDEPQKDPQPNDSRIVDHRADELVREDGANDAPPSTATPARLDLLDRSLRAIRSGSASSARRAVEELVRSNNEAGTENSEVILDVIRRTLERRSRLLDACVTASMESESPSLRADAWLLYASQSSRGARRLFWSELSERPLDSDLVEFMGQLLAQAPQNILRGLMTDASSTVSPAVRNRFAEALGQTGDERAWPLLQHLIQSFGPEPALVQAAGECGDPRALTTLSRWGEHTGERGLAALDAIGRLRGPESLRYLLRRYADLRTPTGVAMEAHRATVTQRLQERSDETLQILKAELHASAAMSPHSIVCLNGLFPSEAPTLLAEVLQRRPELADRVFPALIGNGSEEAIERVIAALDAPALRRPARRALQKIARRDLGPHASAWRQWASQSARNRQRNATATQQRFHVLPSRMNPLSGRDTL